MAKTKPSVTQSNARTSNGISPATTPTRQPAKEADLRVSIRGDVLNHVNSKLDQRLNKEIERLEDKFQIEIERTARDREEKLIPRLKQSIESKIMQDIRQSGRVNLDDEVKGAIKTTVDSCIALQTSANDKVVPPKEVSTDSPKVPALPCQGCEVKSGKATTEDIETAVTAERRARVNCILQLQNTLTRLRADMKTMDSRFDTFGKATTQSLTAAAESVQQALSALQTGTDARITSLEKEILSRIDESQSALAEQVEHVTALWQRIEQMRLAMERLDTPTTSHREPMDLLGEQDDLMSFEVGEVGGQG